MKRAMFIYLILLLSFNTSYGAKMDNNLEINFETTESEMKEIRDLLTKNNLLNSTLRTVVRKVKGGYSIYQGSIEPYNGGSGAEWSYDKATKVLTLLYTEELAPEPKDIALNATLRSLIKQSDIIVTGILKNQATRGTGHKGTIEISGILYGTCDDKMISFVMRAPQMRPIEDKERIWFLRKKDANDNRDLIFTNELSSIDISSKESIINMIESQGSNSFKEVVSEKSKTKKGVSGYYIFIQDHLQKLRLANTPYTGSSASSDFVKEWEALTPAERDKYNNRATSK